MRTQRRAGRQGGRRSRRGFTLIELMIVAVVLGILAAAIVPRLIDRAKTARIKRAQSDIAAMETAMELFYLDVGRFPTTEEGLRALYYQPDDEAGNWDGPYLRKPLFKDPWNREYVYRCPGTQSDLPYEVVSYGKDGQEGGEGENADVHNWVEDDAG